MKERHLFKAKRLDNGEWVQGCYIYDIDRDSSESLNEFAHRIQPLYAHAYAEPVNPSTICQCTGLKDKNGNLIWENDIVKINNSEINALITFRDFEIICTIPREKYYKHRLEYTTEYKVVGNVFDNPELLEGSYDGE